MTGGLFEKPFFRIAGDRGLLVEFGNAIDSEINRKIRTMAIALGKNPPSGIVEYIPTYRSIIVIYDPLKTNAAMLQQQVIALEKQLAEIPIPPPETVEVPVCYGGEFGPEIEFVAKTHGLSVDDVIRIHSEAEYQVYMIGFTPGFPFLGGLPESLHTPRLQTPRKAVPAGSVGIANNQTGVYPIESPGGWQLIGRTPLRIFDQQRAAPFLIKAGDRLKFKPISFDEYQALKEACDR
ncbi:MAG: 5-oxoprolinase subunit PxpB [Desulfobacterales bacterium]|jgi:KipI family sensor histidine kinase inhibitor|nr:5-oxoprolinase subunit PxpB [Desulfobacterales bacterium]